VAKIYLSSTFEDLKAYRETVYRTLRQMRHDVLAMENYIATDMRPLDLCLIDVATSDLYVGIFAWRYGYIPPKDNPEYKSITEREYRKAIELHKPTLIFLLEKDAPWPPTQMDLFTGDGEHGKLIAELRQELGLEKTVSFFNSQEQLAKLVSTAVANWEKGIPFADPRTKYLEHVYKHYNTVKLPIGPSEGLSLQATFQPLKLRRDPLAAEDLERENRRTLLSEMEDETDGLTQTRSKQKAHEHYNRILLASSEVIAKNGEEAIEKSSQGRLIVLGGPGTGKTTLLKYLVSDRARKALIDPTTSVPVYLSLADLARKEVSFQRYLVELVEEMSADRGYAEVLWREIENGRAFICLDSLDEVAPQQRQKMIELIHNLVAIRGNTWIIGSRFTEYKGGDFKHGQFSDWELQPMDHKLRLEMAEGLLPELQRLLFIPPSVSLTPQHFVLRLEKHPQAATWGKNPLLFCLSAVVFIQTGDLPPSRAMLYKDVIDAVIKTRETDPVWRRSLSRMLGALALWIHEKKGRTFSMDDLLDFFADIQGKSWGEETAELVKRLVNSGVIEIVARHTYGFRHQTFQEYLAATELARGLTSDDTKVRENALNIAWSKRTFSRWTEVLRLMVGVLTLEYGKKGKTEAIRWLRTLIEQRTSASGDPGNLGLMLAFKSFGEITKWSEWNKVNKEGLEEEIVSSWVDTLLDAARSNRQTERLRIEILTQEVTYLSKHAIEILTERLVFAFHDWNSNVRYAAAEALGELGERVPLEPLSAALQDPDSSVRSAAAEALGELGERVPSEPIIEMVGDTLSFIRDVAVQTLKKISPTSSETLLFEAVLVINKQGSSVIFDSIVKQEFAQIVHNLGLSFPPLGDKLTQLLKWHYWPVRATAAQALGKLRRNISDEAIKHLLEMRHNPHECRAVQEAADDALSEILSLESIEDD